MLYPTELRGRGARDRGRILPDGHVARKKGSGFGLVWIRGAA